MDKEYDEQLQLRLQEYVFVTSGNPDSAQHVIAAMTTNQGFSETGQPGFTRRPKKNLHS